MDPIYQLLSGNVAILLDGDVFFIASPDINTKHLAEIYSQQEYERAFSEGMMTQENAIELCIETGEWSPEEEELLSNKLPKNIEQMKLDYYKRFYITSSRKEIKNKIDELTKKINMLYHKKMVYFSSTCEYIKKDLFDNYCIENCIFDENYKKIDSGIFNINTISKKYDEKRLSSKEIRDYSKNGKWRLIWSAAKENGTPFSNKDLNEDQLELIS